MAKNVGMAGFVFSVLGVLTFWVPFLGTLLTLIAILSSKSALAKIKHQPKKHSGSFLALVGLILGIVFFILSLCALGLVVFLFGSGYLVGKFI
jgi:hypothetical protein